MTAAEQADQDTGLGVQALEVLQLPVPLPADRRQRLRQRGQEASRLRQPAPAPLGAPPAADRRRPVSAVAVSSCNAR